MEWIAVGQRTSRFELTKAGAWFQRLRGRDFALLTPGRPGHGRGIILIVEGDVATAIADTDLDIEDYVRSGADVDLDIEVATAKAMGLADVLEATGASPSWDGNSGGYCWSAPVPACPGSTMVLRNEEGCLWAAKGEPVWLVERRSETGAIAVCELSFAQALSMATRLPNPRRGERRFLTGAAEAEEFLLVRSDASEPAPD